MELKDEKIKYSIDKNEDNYNSEKNNSEIKKKRRSKNDLNGRMHKCECGKAYLSQLALSNHRKSKHENNELKENDNYDNMNSDFSNSNLSKKRRGRPKKNNNQTNNNFEDPEYHYKLYFKKEYRKKRENESYSITDFIDFVFQEIYVANRHRCLLKINNTSEHPLLSFIIKSENSQNQINICENNKNVPVNNTENMQIENINIKVENNKSQIKNKTGIVNFTIEKKYKNNNNQKKTNNNEKEEIRDSTNRINNEITNNLTELKVIEVKTEIKNTQNSMSETKELLVNLDPNLHSSPIDNEEKNILISKLKQKGKFSNFKRLGLNRNQLENINNKESYDSNNNNLDENQNKNHKIKIDSAFRSYSKRENQNNQSQKNICCDEIFYEYLKSITKYANQKYFVFIFKFIIIFRECINTYKNIELENSILVLNENIPLDVKEFTQYYDAEQAPELCNEFISEYLQSCDYFGFEKNEIPEIIDIIQHFCYWMYENNYTSSRLSLLNMN